MQCIRLSCQDEAILDVKASHNGRYWGDSGPVCLPHGEEWIACLGEPLDYVIEFLDIL